MEIILEFLIWFLVETVGQLIVEIAAELGIRGTSHALGYKKPKNPYLASIGYVLLAAIAAGVSLYFIPNHLVDRPEMRVLNLALSPIAVGFLMALRGKLLLRKQKEPIRIDSFFYGYLFALTFGLIRYFFGR